MPEKARRVEYPALSALSGAVNLTTPARNRLSSDEADGPLGTSNELAPLPVDHVRLRRAVREMLAAIGEDPDREGLLDTPDRVARMYAEVFAGLHTDPAIFLQKTFTQKHDEMVLVKDIEFASMCEHHLLPFAGKAHIAYLPNGRIVGLSKLARVVDAVARRPQVQERMTEEIADLVMTHLKARGVGVIVEASHSCMSVRGVRKPAAMTITSSMRGGFLDHPATRAELMSLVFGGSRDSSAKVPSSRVPSSNGGSGSGTLNVERGTWNCRNSEPPLVLDTKQITEDLRGQFRGRLHFDRLTRGLYATDASSFQIEPLAVAVPEDVESVANLVRYCHGHNVPVIPRGAGTGMAGESLGPAVILDLSVHFRRILAVGADTVTVQPGVVLNDLNAELAKIGRRFAPDPASAATCTLGGMIATNASGGNAFHHGYTRDYVAGLSVVWDTGEESDLTPQPPSLRGKGEKEAALPNPSPKGRGAFWLPLPS